MLINKNKFDLIETINQCLPKMKGENSNQLLLDVELIEGEFCVNWDKQAKVFWEKVAKQYR